MTNRELMQRRLELQGGIAQDKRMIQDKYRAFLWALKYSYQACDVRRVQKVTAPMETDLDTNILPLDEKKCRALINPDKLKQDYDDKIFSIDYNAGYQPGDVFEWQTERGPLTQWLVYLPAMTEDAYFESEIRRCKYIIKFRDDKDGKVYATYAAIRGPVETKIESIQKNQIRIDVPNLSLNILIPKNEQTVRLFKRYSEFMLDGKCWRVQASDSISIEGVIEINAEEYYKDRDTDTDEIKDGLIEFEPIPSLDEGEIHGNGIIKPKITETYSVEADTIGTWSTKLGDTCAPVKLEVDGNIVKLTWLKSISCSSGFELQWKTDSETRFRKIVVESLF